MTQRPNSSIRQKLKITVTATVVSFLLGCGQKGPLHLPQEKPTQAKPESKSMSSSKVNDESSSVAPKRDI
ncbi:lipoprotein [Psychrosphaera ytuae]|uniref:Lipoprotein n=1 Tax=Psychrosphaera ytuae TaxID=2820710 RepID=A0A975D910_9GAMM|nr:lipoprotein [Psychrosphaera ytuae]QTH62732.1 lipoprotein [Psychrosphaera ytuae]